MAVAKHAKRKRSSRLLEHQIRRKKIFTSIGRLNRAKFAVSNFDLQRKRSSALQIRYPLCFDIPHSFYSILTTQGAVSNYQRAVLSKVIWF